MKDLKLIFWIVLSSLILNGCNMDELDFDRISDDVNLSPEVVFPIANGNITVWDFVNAVNKENENLISKEPNGLVKIVYRQNDLFNYYVRDLIDFPAEKNFSSGDKPLGYISPEEIRIVRDISLNELVNQSNGALNGIGMLNGMTAPFPPVSATDMNAQFGFQELSDYNTITMGQGTLEVHLENKMKVPITVKGVLYDKVYNRNIAAFTFIDIAPNGFKNIPFNVAGIELSNQLEFRMNSFETPGSVSPVLINMEDFFMIKFKFIDMGISSGNLMIANPKTLDGYNGNFEFTFPESDLKAFGAVLKKGSVSIKSVNNLPVTGTINFTLTEIIDKNTGKPITTTIPLNGNSTVIPLDEAMINFASDPENPYNRIPYTYSITFNSSPGFFNYSSTDVINLEVMLNNLEFKSVTGDYGKSSIEIEPGVFALDVEMLDKLNGDFKLVNPALVLSVRNSMGIPSAMTFDFTASNMDGNTVSLNAPAFDIPVPTDINAGVAIKNVVFNKQNSAIIDLIALPPTGKISFGGRVDFNTTGVVTPQNPNFLDIDGLFGIDLAMELPLELQISNLGFKDTTGITGSDFEDIETAELILNARNGIPLDVEMQLLFVDTISKQQYGASKITKILSAAQVNTSGEITPVQASHTFSLDKSEMANLRKANGLVFSGSISSPDLGATAAPLFSDSKIELNVVIKSKLNL